MLVTALESVPNRLDWANRPIRNSVAWTFEVDEDGKREKIIRSIAILALKNELSKIVCQAISNIDNQDYGFEVASSTLNSIGYSFHDELGDLSPNLKRWISGDSEYIRQQLCDELKSNKLPKHEGLLILVTTLKNKDFLRTEEVWRGLSTRSKEDIEWLENNNLAQPDTSQKKTITNKSMTIVALGLIFILSLLLFLGVHVKSTPVNPSQESPIQQEETNQIKMIAPQTQTQTQIPSST
ncbi:MAG: hypothetical protein HC799_19020 [Limnothrix sp. RL_2_0]|nr:hypothetical protein [Limnothrix sp. RL_2_0]